MPALVGILDPDVLRAIDRAKQRHPGTVPVVSRGVWAKCITEHKGRRLLWYDDAGGSCHIEYITTTEEARV